MIEEKTLTKRYYKIGEVAKMFNLATSSIRYWETEFPQLRPIKGKNGVRRYRKEDVLIINQIYQLVKVRKFKLDGARKALAKQDVDLVDNRNANLKQLRFTLNNLKSQLSKLKHSLDSNYLEEE